MRVRDLFILAAIVFILQLLVAPTARLIWRDLVAPIWPVSETVGPERQRLADARCEARSLNQRRSAGARCHGDLGARAVCMLA
ncbi:MAG TPA: hypothetical protein DC061_15195 [Gemmobacter sp.]|nr:hypothetical protein [Gemmobacter sp.]